jgi:hypothetical protein
MEIPTKEIIDILLYLLPGLIAAWVYYGLTSFPKPSQFERVIQALVFTVIIQGVTSAMKWILLGIGDFMFSIGVWNDNTRLVTSVIIAFLLGLLFCKYSNNDKIHEILRKLKITKLTSFPSEWYGVFGRNQTYIVLHLNDGRRLYGWPLEWPNKPDSGHFSITEAEWLTDNGSIKLDSVRIILLPATEVKFVEFMKLSEDETSHY